MNADNRGLDRVRTILAARLVFDEGGASVDCQVKDLTAEGARIALAGVVATPHECVLDIPRRQLRKRCRIVWRNAEQIGVAFLEERQPAREISPEARIRELEDKNADLRKLVKRLQAELSIRQHREGQLG